MAIDVQVADRFKGPMDLLLYLIKRDEIDIHDIPIRHITAEFQKAMDEMESLDVQAGADFVNMASMLMEIKSRMLLPPEEVEEDEETLEIDPRADLVEALLEYKRFKEASRALETLYEEASRRFPRAVPVEPEAAEVPPEEAPLDADLDQLYFAFLKLAEELSAGEAGTIVTTEISTEETMEHIRERLDREGRIPFRAFFGPTTTRHEMVVHFVAVLELMRLRRIRAFQTEAFGDIYVEAIPDEPHALQLPDAAGRGGGLAGCRRGRRRILYMDNRLRPVEDVRALPAPGQSFCFLPVPSGAGKVPHKSFTGKGMCAFPAAGPLGGAGETEPPARKHGSKPVPFLTTLPRPAKPKGRRRARWAANRPASVGAGPPEPASHVLAGASESGLAGPKAAAAAAPTAGRHRYSQRPGRREAHHAPGGSVLFAPARTEAGGASGATVSHRGKALRSLFAASDAVRERRRRAAVHPTAPAFPAATGRRGRRC